MSNNILYKLYNDQIKEKGYRASPMQLSLVKMLDSILGQLGKFINPTHLSLRGRGLFRICFEYFKRIFLHYFPSPGIGGGWGFQNPITHPNKEAIIQGVYLYSPPGRGKTMIMHMFYDSIPFEQKAFFHFHDFIKQIHERNISKNYSSPHKDPVEQMAYEFASKYRVICMDELMVQDVADSIIIRKLFTKLAELGVFVIFSSNRKPEDLYQNGLQKHLFEEFIHFLNHHFLMYNLEEEGDFRQKNESAQDGRKLFIAKNEDEGFQFIIRSIMEEVSDKDEKEFSAIELQIPKSNRAIKVEKTIEEIAFFEYEELFAENFGATDYGVICNKFSKIFISNIPSFSKQSSNEALRFVNFVDIAYKKNNTIYASFLFDYRKITVKEMGVFELERAFSRLCEIENR